MGVDAKPPGPENNENYENNESNQSKQSKQANVTGPRLSRRVAIAVPALAAIATAAVLSTQALSSSPVADVKPAPHKAAAANLAITTSPAARAALAKAASQAKASTAKKAGKAKVQHTQLDRRTLSVTHWYTVRSGDTLSGIAGRFYHQTSAWPAIYYANRGKISSADVISPGEVLRIPAKPAHIPGAPSAPVPSVAVESATSAGQSAAQGAAQSTASSGYSGGGYPGGAFGACVVARESGGNSQVMNSSGHYGLYQFSYSTWVAYGGNPGDFGHASVAEQNAVFATALARGGQSNWSPYDGC